MTERRARLAASAAVASFGLIAVLLSERTPAQAWLAGAALAVVLLGIAVTNIEGVLLAGGYLAAGALLTVICHNQPANLGWFGICVLAGWSGYTLQPWLAGLVTAIGALGFVVQWIALADEPGWGAWIAGTVFSGVACILARQQQLLLVQLREAQAGLAQRAAAEERNRIAHELHDVIGHALTVSLLHITTARLALDEDPAEAGEALEQAERLAQQSLADVRAVVGMMKDPSAPAPLPGVGEIDALVESFRGAGTAVEYAVTGDLARLTATEGLTVYRILQEALTNVARHAPGSPATVHLHVEDGETRVRVDSSGRPGRPSHDGAGLAGMRERAEALGGRLTAGPSGNGWRVEAVLPA
jgi:signal transduction histidine kinase